ncbi:type II toxin-antitoxin system VapC family toxin [Nanobdella aerobiophila]
MAKDIKELDFEDAIHYATMKYYNIDKIISNDKDFDKLCKRIF